MAEQMSWDISTKEKALFEQALDGEDLPWEELMLDESGGSLDTEMPDMAAEPTTPDGEDSPSVIDDDDGSHVSEAHRGPQGGHARNCMRYPSLQVVVPVSFGDL